MATKEATKKLEAKEAIVIVVGARPDPATRTSRSLESSTTRQRTLSLRRSPTASV
jgi:hypothetical protein